MLPKTTVVSWANAFDLCCRLADAIHTSFRDRETEKIRRYGLSLYGVPRGGLIPAAIVFCRLQSFRPCRLVEDPADADVFIDDLVDSGDTAARYSEQNPSAEFHALLNKSGGGIPQWIEFPWERMGGEALGVENNITRILQFIGEDPKRDGLRDTPKRVAKSYAELYSGYRQNVAEVFKTFEQPCDEMVLLKDVEFSSMCEHHMLPFFGRAHIGYIPNGRVIGVSKLVRVLEVYSKRLQIQERICSDVTSALMAHLQPLGAACVLEAEHFCMKCRGVNKQHSKMVTSSLTGAFRDQPAVRAEFMTLISR